MPLFLFVFVPGSRLVSLSCHVSLDFSRLSQFLILSVFWITLPFFFFWVFVKFFVGFPSILICLMFFLMIKLGLWVLGRKMTEVKCHFRPVLSSVHSVSMIHALTVITWLRCLPASLLWSYRRSSSSGLHFWGQSHAHPHLGSRGATHVLTEGSIYEIWTEV